VLEVLYTGDIFRWQEAKREKNKDGKKKKIKPDRLDVRLKVKEQQLGAGGRPVEGKTSVLGTVSGIVPLDRNGRYLFEDLVDQWTGRRRQVRRPRPGKDGQREGVAAAGDTL